MTQEPRLGDGVDPEDDFAVVSAEAANTPADISEEELRSAAETAEEEENAPEFVFEESAKEMAKNALTNAGNYTLEVFKIRSGVKIETGNQWGFAALRHPQDADGDCEEAWMKGRYYDFRLGFNLSNKSGRAELAAFANNIGWPDNKGFVLTYKSGKSDFDGYQGRFYIGVRMNSQTKLEENTVRIGRAEKPKPKDTSEVNVDEVEL